MKLDVVLEMLQRGPAPGWRRLGGALVLGACLAWTGSAIALDGIDLSAPPDPMAEEAEPAAADDCPPLVKIKYPFLSCSGGTIGLSSESATWENSRQIPRAFDWIEGGGYFGPPHNGRDRDNE